MARKKYEAEAENHERWLISYADFITLLFAFFVVMYAISVVNEGKYKVFAMSLDAAFAGKDTVVVMVPGQATPVTVSALPSPAQRKRAEALRREREALKKLAQDLSATLAPLVKEGKVKVTQNSLGVQVEINASVLFDPGEARLAPDSEQALRALGALLKEDTHAIQVEGHTDDTRIATPVFASNWELSAVRASSVVRLFIDSGVAPSRLTAVGRASNLPVAANDTPEGKARNRRVAVTILSALPDTVTEIPTN
ncbi:MAG TPA: flagellar motor protein MotD [Telluria sp.]|jgi:chemotaxis protein MotB